MANAFDIDIKKCTICNALKALEKDEYRERYKAIDYYVKYHLGTRRALCVEHEPEMAAALLRLDGVG